MAITKSKGQIYEWITTKNWFKSYEKNLFSNPRSIRVRQSGCSNFKDYLDYAFKKLIECNKETFIEFLIVDSIKEGSGQSITYWSLIDTEYWHKWMNQG